MTALANSAAFWIGLPAGPAAFKLARSVTTCESPGLPGVPCGLEVTKVRSC